MKGRPDTAQFKPHKDPDDFLSAARSDGLEKPTAKPAAPRVHREQKIFRLPVNVIADLKRVAYERSVQSGHRVTETDLVEQALKSYLSICISI